MRFRVYGLGRPERLSLRRGVVDFRDAQLRILRPAVWRCRDQRECLDDDLRGLLAPVVHCPTHLPPESVRERECVCVRERGRDRERGAEIGVAL